MLSASAHWFVPRLLLAIEKHKSSANIPDLFRSVCDNMPADEFYLNDFPVPYPHLVHFYVFLPGPEVIKKILCSTQLNMKFFLLINVKMPTVVGILTFMSK